MTSLIEDYQAWIDKGQESWKSYFSKWEAFAEYEESFPESELIHKLSDKCKKRRNGNQKLLKLPLARTRMKRVFFKNQPRKQKEHIKKKKGCQKGEVERRSHDDENLVEILENKQLEFSLMTIFSDLLKANTNKCELFSVLFQMFTDREVTVKESNHLLSRQQLLPCSKIEIRMADFSIGNPRFLSVAMPGNNLSLENQRFLSECKLTKNLHGRSICPPRHVCVQSLNEDVQEINSEQMQRNLGQCQSPKVGAMDADSISRNNFSKQQSSNSEDSQTPILQKRRNCPYGPNLFGIKNTKSVESDYKFPESCQNKEYIRSTTSCTSKHVFGLSMYRKNRISLGMNNANFKTALKKLSEHKHFNKILSQKRHSSKKLISDYNENDSDSEDQTKYRSPIIYYQNKRLKGSEQVVAALEPDADDCQHIFDRVMKS